MEALKPLERKIKSLVFNLLKLLLVHGQKGLVPIDGNNIEKILFIRPGKLGDMIISLPVFEAIKKYFPHIKISTLATPRGQMIIENDNRFFKKYLFLKSPLKDLKTLREIRKDKYDCVVDMIREDSVTTLIFSQLSALGKPRIGLAKTKFEMYYDYNDPYEPNNSKHMIENSLKILDAFGIDSTKESGYAEMFLTKQELEFAQKNLQVFTNPNNRKIVGYNLSAGAPNRIWAKEKSIELLNKIKKLDTDFAILLITAPNERDRAVYLQNAVQFKVHIIPENLNFSSVAAFVKYLDILISPDTSLVHIARSFRIPVVGLYGSSKKNYMLWHPYGQEIGSVVSDKDDKIFDISVEQVVNTFRNITEQVA